VADLDALNHALASRVFELCRDILPNGRRQGQEWCVGSIAGEPGGSLSVRLSGPRAGWWADFSSTEYRGRGALSLIAAVKTGGDFREAIIWARRWLGEDVGRHQALQRAAQRRPSSQYQHSAKALFLAAQSNLAGTPVAAYLAERAIALDELPRRPHFLRYAPRLRHSGSRQEWPGMVAAVVDHKGKFLAAHRTFLWVEAGGTVGKAPITPNKMMLGPVQGGVIPVWPGLHGKAWPAIAPGEKCAVCEGIEDALSVAVLFPAWRVVAAGSVGNLARIVLPAGFGRIVIAAQNDPTFNAQGGVHEVLAALDAAVRNFRRQGVEVGITRPRIGKDFNDFLMVFSGRAEERAREAEARAEAAFSGGDDFVDVDAL
jgi:hypothetical protein